MAYCENCGAKLSKNAKFCPECGTPVNSGSGKREEVYQGELHKCPNCGEPLKAFQSVCPACGYEIRNAKASDAVKEFSDELKRIEAGRKQKTLIGGVTQSLGLTKKDDTDEKIVNHIRNFAVPNTKEDVFEFMILASSNINTSAISAEYSSDAGANNTEELNAIKARNDAWIAKVEQVYNKAKLSFGSDPDFEKIQEIYDRTNGSIKTAQKKKSLKSLKIVALVVAWFVVFGGFFGCQSMKHHQKEAQLEKTVQEIQVDIANGDYDDALIKAQSLHMDDNWSSESREHWDQQREDLIKLIEEKKEAAE